MQYSREFISEREIPRARNPILQHLLARARLAPLAALDEAGWLAEVPFFDIRRQR